SRGASAGRRAGCSARAIEQVAVMARLDASMATRAALVTGASRGIGAAVARAFSERGAKVGLLSRSGDSLGLPDALGVACDVREREDVFAATAQVVERFGSLDCVVANAGIGAYGPFLELPL